MHGAISIHLVKSRIERHTSISARGQVRSVTFERPHVQVGPGELVDLARHSYSGETDFQLALDAGREIIGERPFTRADVIFITDGIAALTAEYLQDLLGWKQRTGARIFTVVVSGASPASVEQWSDRVQSDADIFVDARRFDAAARQIFRSV
jgi:uncharacterized protein with von Willebrand factor type A (vWA) domain